MKYDNRSRSTWYYVLVVEDDEKMWLCTEKIQRTNAAVERSINLSNCGEVLESGWGKDHPNNIREKQYGLK